MWHFFTLIISFVPSFLRDESAANAAEYALIMALFAVFIIIAVLAMNGAIWGPIN